MRGDLVAAAANRLYPVLGPEELLMPDLSLTPLALTAFFATVVVMALTPGPDMVLYLGKAVSQSRKAGLITFAGAATGLLVHTTLAALGLSALLAASATAFTIVKIAGALYLVYLAYDAIRHGSAFKLEASATQESPHALYVKGLLVNLLNPKIVIFFLTLLPQFVAADDPNAKLTMIVLGVGFIVIAAPICVVQILAASAIARFLKRSRWAMRAVDFTFAGVMSVFAIKLALSEGR
jgi:threonine/homoserine/homoserine lactone efflux protein